MNIVRVSMVAAVLVCTSAAGAPRAAGSDTSTATRATPGDEEVMQRARHAETTYRHRLARLRRLRHLAQEHGDAERLAELDRLYERLHKAHRNRIERFRSHMDAAARARLDARLDAGRDRFEWRQEKREEHFDHRQDVRQKRFDQRQDRRDDRFEHRQDARQERFDQRQTRRDERSDHRQDARREHFDQRQERRDDRFEHRQDRRQEHVEHRQDKRVERFDHRQDRRRKHFDKRQAVRDEAEAKWRVARDRAASEAGGRPFRRHPALRHSEARWQAEAHDHVETRRHRAERWRKAARRDGILPADGDDKSGAAPRDRLLTQREADDAAARNISRENADAELKRLREEIESDE
jgi:hypothetical protein